MEEEMMAKKEKEEWDEFLFDFSKLEEVGEEKEKEINRKIKISVNKVKITVMTVEIIIVIYFILALLGFVPFF